MEMVQKQQEEQRNLNEQNETKIIEQTENALT